MGKHFEEDTRRGKRLQESKKSKITKNVKSEKTKKENSSRLSKTIIVIILLTIVSIIGVYIFLSKSKITENTIKEDYNIVDFQEKSVEGEKLVLKSVYENNKIIEYIFNNNKLTKIKIYERYMDIEKFNDAKESYSNREDIEIISIDEKNFAIEYEKKDFGTDKDLSYNEIYNKYMKIVGAYEKI